MPLHVAIIGGGLGGLTLAGFLNKYSDDIVVDLYEKRQHISASVGETIAIWKRTWEVVRDLDLQNELIAQGFPLPVDGVVIGATWRRADMPRGGFDFQTQQMPYGPAIIPRPELVEMLTKRLTSNTTIHPSKTVESYTLGDPVGVTLHFTDGTTEHCDILVGCDGIHSSVRAKMFESAANDAGDSPKAEELRGFISPKWHGSIAYRTSVKLDELANEFPQNGAIQKAKMWCGNTKHIVSLPVAPRNMINVVLHTQVQRPEDSVFPGKSWNEPCSEQEVRDSVAGWEPEVGQILKHMSPPRRLAIHVVEPLPFWTMGPVALLGDAAHAMTTHQGIGGAQAIEDAYLLGRLIAHPKFAPSNAQDIFRLYEEIRLPLTADAYEKSKSNGMLYDFVHPDFPITNDSSVDDLRTLGDEIDRSFAWLGKGGCYEEWDKVEEYVQAHF